MIDLHMSSSPCFEHLFDLDFFPDPVDFLRVGEVVPRNAAFDTASEVRGRPRTV
jgi:hypothetical protein